mmetsp:Transcript_6445/g.20583  ORF Transcript_6445/g.20583 Transcript_6445/m.20583 type:complete len:299 (-) Transcript_6445:185-1081(-)
MADEIRDELMRGCCDGEHAPAGGGLRSAAGGSGLDSSEAPPLALGATASACRPSGAAGEASDASEPDQSGAPPERCDGAAPPAGRSGGGSSLADGSSRGKSVPGTCREGGAGGVPGEPKSLRSGIGDSCSTSMSSGKSPSPTSKSPPKSSSAPDSSPSNSAGLPAPLPSTRQVRWRFRPCWGGSSRRCCVTRAEESTSSRSVISFGFHARPLGWELLRMIEFHRFLMSLSVRSGMYSSEICAHLVPSCSTRLQIATSSSCVQSPLLSSGLRWLRHRSRHCLPLRMWSSVAICTQFFTP